MAVCGQISTLQFVYQRQPRYSNILTSDEIRYTLINGESRHWYELSLLCEAEGVEDAFPECCDKKDVSVGGESETPWNFTGGRKAKMLQGSIFGYTVTVDAIGQGSFVATPLAGKQEFAIEAEEAV